MYVRVCICLYAWSSNMICLLDMYSSVAYGATPVELGAQVLPADGAKAPVITLTGTKVGTK